MSDDRIIFHCDCNSFFASVELLSHPELRDKPVAVCGDPDSRHGIILAKNEAAKKFKVQTAETIYSAKRKCPDLILLPSHHDKYREYSRRVNAIYAQYTDLIEPFGIDESWLDVTHTWRLFAKSAPELADNLREQIKRETGLTISVGVSFNKVFAKLGSDYKKPDATTLITRENFKQLVWRMNVGEMLYVGKNVQQTLAGLGVKNLGQLAALDVKTAQDAMGKLGPELVKYARGDDDSAVRNVNDVPEVKSVGNGLTFKRNLIGADDIRAGIFALADEVASRLRRHALYANAVQVMIKTPEFKSISRQQQLDAPTFLAKEIGDLAYRLVCANYGLDKPIRMLTVTALNLTDGSEAQQLSFFDDAPKKANKKRENLEKSLDAIRAKYGKHSIAQANVIKNDIGLSDIETDEK